MRGQRRGRAGRRRCAPPWAAEPRLGSQAPKAARAALETSLRQQRLETARAVEATALGDSGRHFGVHRLVPCRLRTRWAAAPLGGATARDGQRPTETPAAHLPARRWPPGGLHGRGGAQDAAAVLKRAPPVSAPVLCAGAAVPPREVRLGPAAPEAPPGAMSRSRSGAGFP